MRVRPVASSRPASRSTRSDRRADPAVGAFEPRRELAEGSAEERQRGAVVARDERGELGDARRPRVGDELRRQRRADAALLVLVGDLEGDLCGATRADDARDRDRTQVVLEVGDERVVPCVDRGEPAQLVGAEARLRAVEAASPRLLAEPLEDGQHRANVPTTQRPHEEGACVALEHARVHVSMVGRTALPPPRGSPQRSAQKNQRWQLGQMPSSSIEWWSTRKPVAARTFSSLNPSAASSTSTLRPHSEQTMWWWWGRAAHSNRDPRSRQSTRRTRPSASSRPRIRYTVE